MPFSCTPASWMMDMIGVD